MLSKDKPVIVFHTSETRLILYSTLVALTTHYVRLVNLDNLNYWKLFKNHAIQTLATKAIYLPDVERGSSLIIVITGLPEA